MSYVLEFKEEANLDIIEAYHYYEENRKGLGDEFLEHLDTYFERITENPDKKRNKPPISALGCL